MSITDTGPRVSVLMAVYNGARYLREAVDSILHQTFTDFEFIIIDDGSTDETWTILSGYADRRIRLVRNEQNIGLSKSLNKGLALARGEYIARMDGDDIGLPERLQAQVAHLTRSGCTVCFTRVHIHEAHSASITGWQEYPWPVAVWKGLFGDDYGLHPSVMFSKARILESGGYDESFRNALDYELFERLCAAGDVFGYVPEPLLIYRRHDRQLSVIALSDQEGEARRVSFRAMRRYLPNLSDPEAGALRWLFLGREPQPPTIPSHELLPRADRLVAAFLQSPLHKGWGGAVWRSVVDSIAQRYAAFPSPRMKRAAWQSVLGACYRLRDLRLLVHWLRLVRRKLFCGSQSDG